MNQTEQKPRWTVAVEGHDHDLRGIASALREEGVWLDQTEKEGWLVTADVFDGVAEADAVRSSADEILAMVNGAGVLLDPGFRPLKAGHVYRLHADGRKEAFVLLQSAIEIRAHVNAVLVSTAPDGSLPPPPTSQLDKSLAAAAVDPNLSSALRLNGQYPRTFVSLYKIFELSQQHPQNETWSSKKQRKRFTHSANSPSVHGDDARHAASRTQPPSSPMSLKDAEAFIAVIMARWVDTVWDSRNRGESQGS